MPTGERPSGSLHPGKCGYELLLQVTKGVEIEVDRLQCADVLPVPFLLFPEPRGEIVVSGRGAPTGLQEMVVDAPVRHPPDGGAKLPRGSDPLSRIEYDGGRFEKEELVPRGGGRDRDHFAPPLVEDVQGDRPEFLEGTHGKGVEYAQPLREHPVR